MELRTFGTLPDGRPVQAARLARPGGLELEVLDYGATIRSLRVPGRSQPIEAVLGFETLDDYVQDRSYQGPVVGRCANRIDGASFTLDGETYRVTANEGANCLHGGALGFSRRLWRFVDANGADAVTLAYTSPDREEGFPGEVDVRATYALTADAELTITWEARTDRPCPVNLTQHLYFNLSEQDASGRRAETILDHELSIAADAITPVRDDLIPTGALQPVQGTPFDLRAARRIGDALAEPHPQIALAKGYDHNWALRPEAAPALRLRSPKSGVALSIITDQPGMQVYSGQGLGAPFGAHGGVVFEPQGFPDAVNQPSFPNVVLRPGEPYRRRAVYQFEAGAPGRQGR